MKQFLPRVLSAFLFVWLSSQTILAQAVSFSDVLAVRTRNMGEIISGNEIKGYYLFLHEDQIDRKTHQFRLRILDINLREVGTETISGSAYMSLAEGVYNGTYLMLKFVDLREKTHSFRFYDTSGKLVKQLSVPATKQDLLIFQASLEKGEVMEAATFSVEGKGFINLSMTKESDYGFKVQYFGQDRSFLGWTYQTDPTSKETQFADFIGISNDVLLIQVIKKKSILSSKMDAYLLGVDLKTGKKRYETKLATPTNNIFLINGLQDEKTGNFIAFGQFSELDDNAMKDNSLGFCATEVSATGQLTKTKLVYWDKDVSEFLPVDYRGKAKGWGYIFFHKIVQLQDGRIYAIGEQYKKAASGVGIAVVALGGSAALTKMVIQDMMVFEFDPNFTLKGVSVFEKGKTSIELPAGADLNGPHVLARYILAYGGFDYAYTQLPNDKSEFTFFVKDWEKEKGEKGRTTLKSVNRSGDNYTLDKIDLLTEASALDVFPAKPGYVMIAEYSRKLRKLDFRLEKFNR